MDNIIELLKDTLYITFSSKNNLAIPPSYSPFYADKSLIYTAFFADFGPLDLGLTCKFCRQLEDKIKQKRPVLFVASDHPQLRANSAVLICAYMIFVMNFTVEKAYGPFIGIEPPFHTFRDAGFCINTYPITVLDCARSMDKAKSLGHFNYNSFCSITFHNLAKLQNGDVSWIIPNKFIAFSGPIAKRRQISVGVNSLIPEEYVPLMKNLGVSCIVRFNSKCYDRNVFIANGIRHVDLFYEDGGNPTEPILQAFLTLCENERGAIAVHCKAGLGRTGTNIAAYMIKHYGYTVKESIAWCRLCRPGSIVGPQQQYLASIEGKLIQEGIQYRKNKSALPKPEIIPSSPSPLISSIINVNKSIPSVSLYQSLNNDNERGMTRPSTSGGPPSGPPSSSSFSMRIRRDVNAKRGIHTGSSNVDAITSNMANVKLYSTVNNNNTTTVKMDFSTGTVIRSQKHSTRGGNRPRTSYGYGK